MYALWLLPEPEKETSLSQLIDRLSEEYGGPRFDPHLTLLGNLEGDEKTLIARTSQLAARLKQFTLRTKSIEYREDFYKSLFITIEASSALESARHSAENLFNHMTETVYMPHLSLVYGKQSEQKKENLSKALMEEILFEFVVDRIRLVAAFGPVDKWKSVTELELG
jgi:2'-5' RNA ligase